MSIKIQVISFIFILFLNHEEIIGQKNKKTHDVLSFTVGTQLYSTPIPSPYVKKVFDTPLTLEYQKINRRHIYSVGVQFYHSYNNIYIDSNVYELLGKKCLSTPSSHFGSNTPYCRYYFIRNAIDLRLPLSYGFIMTSTKNFRWFMKVGISINFDFFNHYNDTYPKLDPKSGVLLDPGPFNIKYHFWQLDYQSHTVYIGSGMNYQVTRKLGITANVQYQKNYEYFLFKQPYLQNKLFLDLGSTFILK